MLVYSSKDFWFLSPLPAAVVLCTYPHLPATQEHVLLQMWAPHIRVIAWSVRSGGLLEKDARIGRQVGFGSPSQASFKVQGKTWVRGAPHLWGSKCLLSSPEHLSSPPSLQHTSLPATHGMLSINNQNARPAMPKAQHTYAMNTMLLITNDEMLSFIHCRMQVSHCSKW
jgi:hypothetical protein